MAESYIGRRRRLFSALSEGDEVEYDARALFMDPHKWVSVTFVRWLSTFPAPGAYCAGVINRAIIRMDGREIETDSGYMRPVG